MQLPRNGVQKTGQQGAGTGRLARRIAGHDPRAEEEFVLRYRYGLLKLLRQRTRCCESEAEDLLHDAFVIALQRLRQGTLKEPDRLTGFMFGLARNLAIDKLRKDQKRRADLAEEWLSTLPDSKPGQLSQMMCRERSRMVRRVIFKLRQERDRKILFRYYIAGEDKERIRRDLNLSSLHFNRVLHRARRRYRELYESMSPVYSG